MFEIIMQQAGASFSESTFIVDKRTFDIVSIGNGRVPRYLIRYLKKDIGFVEPFPALQQTWQWRCFDARNVPKGSARPELQDAIRDLYHLEIAEPNHDSVVMNPEGQQPPASDFMLDGITFKFERGELIEMDGEQRVRHEVLFPGQSTRALKEHHELPQSSGFLISRASRLEEPWIAYYHHTNSVKTRHGLTAEVPFESAVRWLYLHKTYAFLRTKKSLNDFGHAVRRLVHSGEGLCSPNTYRDLCGFVPLESDCWKIYIRPQRLTNPSWRDRPKENFVSFFQGSFDNVVTSGMKALKEHNRKDVWAIVLNGENHIICSGSPKQLFA